MWPNPQETEDLVTFTEEILNGKLHYLCSDLYKQVSLAAVPFEMSQQDVLKEPIRFSCGHNVHEDWNLDFDSKQK